MSIPKREPGACRKKTKLSIRAWAKMVWTAIGTPRSLALSLMSDADIANCEIRPSDYGSRCLRDGGAPQFWLDYQATKLLQKYPGLKTGVCKRSVAEAKFWECERLCGDTNKRILGWKRGIQEFQPEARVARVLFYAQQKIADILGPCPLVEDLPLDFGPGASVSVRGDTSVYKKLNRAPECTIALSQRIHDVAKTVPHWSYEWERLDVVGGAELTFVPKDAKTDRPICIEPLINGFVQKGIGSFMKQRLRLHGVNLYDQGINHALVATARKRALSTVDFSSASDTIASMLVLELLPIDWVDLLDVSRSSHVAPKGSRAYVELEKFSSMGNGYTFELESLIFYALAVSCCRELGVGFQTGLDLHVFGDDVILPRAAFDLFAKVASFCGFKVNTGKSFKEGDFFESCGSDWFQDVPVRPILLKCRISKTKEFYYLANCTYEMAMRASRAGVPRSTVDALLEVHAWVISRIPRGLRLLVPFDRRSESFETDVHLDLNSPDNIGLWAPFDVARPIRHPSWCGFVVKSLLEIPRPQKYDTAIPYSYALYWAQKTGVPWWEADSTKQDIAVEYTSRVSRKVLRVVRTFVPGHWRDPSLPWSERALALVR